MQITEQYVSFETSLLLREKGFVWKHFAPKKLIRQGETVTMEELWGGEWIGLADSIQGNTCYNDEGKEIVPKYYNLNNPHYPRPTLAMAHDWLMIYKKLYIKLTPLKVKPLRSMEPLKLLWKYDIIELTDGYPVFEGQFCLNELEPKDYHTLFDEALQTALKL